MNFTTEAIAELALPEGRADQWIWDRDGKQPTGLGIRMRQGAGSAISKTWYVAYYFGTEKRRDRLGDLSAYTLADARHRAYEIRRAVADRVDPRSVKATALAQAVKASNIPTLGDFAEIYLHRREKKLRPATYRERERYLGRATAEEPNPYFGSLQRFRLDQIDGAMIVAEIDRLEDHGAGAYGKPSAYVAQAARMALLDLFKLAIECGHIEKGKNPVLGTRQPVGKEDRNAGARDRVLTDAELTAVWQACDGDEAYAKIVRLLILTGCRRQEIGGLRWSEIEPNGVWTIPAARVKTG
jgi:integrase